MRAFFLVGCALLLWGCTSPTMKTESIAREARGLTKNDTGQASLTGSGPPRRVLLITVAGLQSSDFLDPWGYAAGPGASVRMPNLARLAREGAMSVAAYPPSPGASRSAHATLATGLLPSAHGIVADETLDESGTRSVPFLDTRMLRGISLWDAAVGRGVLSLDWPTTALARIELLVPEISEEGPGGWLDRIRTQSTPRLVQSIEAAAAADIERTSKSSMTESGARDPKSWPTPGEKDAALVGAACDVAASERDPGLWLLRLSQTEATQHSSGIGSLENAAALAAIDFQLGRLLDCLAAAGRLADTALFVVGDVAYHSVHSSVSPNVALVQSRLIGRDPRSATGVRSWLALVRSQGLSAYVYARDAANALAARDVLETEAKSTGAFRVVSANELGAAGADPQAWFGLVAAPGYQIANESDGRAEHASSNRAIPGVLRVKGAPEAAVGFVAWGRGIRRQVRAPKLELVDVAPTIASLLGLRLGEKLDGRALRGIMRAAVAPPPPGPKRLDVEGKGNASDYLRGDRMGGGSR